MAWLDLVFEQKVKRQWASYGFLGTNEHYFGWFMIFSHGYSVVAVNLLGLLFEAR